MCLCTGYVSASVEGWIPVEYFDPNTEWQAMKYVFKCHWQNVNGEGYMWLVNLLVFHPVCVAHVCLCTAATDPHADTTRLRQQAGTGLC